MKTILFLCPHNAVKGIMAEAYFTYRMQQEGLPYLADSAGTEPDAEIRPDIVNLLASVGVPFSSTRLPRRVTPEDISNATRVISMGCTREELDAPLQPIEWLGHGQPSVNMLID
jgi:protein-tyrosine-phosphatase